MKTRCNTVASMKTTIDKVIDTLKKKTCLWDTRVKESFEFHVLRERTCDLYQLIDLADPRAAYQLFSLLPKESHPLLLSRCITVGLINGSLYD